MLHVGREEMYSVFPEANVSELSFQGGSLLILAVFCFALAGAALTVVHPFL